MSSDDVPLEVWTQAVDACADALYAAALLWLCTEHLKALGKVRSA